MDNFSPEVRLYTDGACIGNPGPGGWGFILHHVATGRRREGSGGEHHTTNNRMEITAVIQGLEALKKPCRVQVFSDSQYVVQAMTAWMPRWKRFGWRRSPRNQFHIRNYDLWQRLDTAMSQHQLQVNWVKGHAGHPENERCDALAQAAADHIAATPAPPAPPPLDRRVDAHMPGLFGAAGDDPDDDTPE